jgi:hypothetical protein
MMAVGGGCGGVTLEAPVLEALVLQAAAGRRGVDLAAERAACFLGHARRRRRGGSL